MALFDVHVFAEMRQKFTNIEAPTQQAACTAVIESSTFQTAAQAAERSGWDYTERLTGFMVEHVGAPDFKDSKFYFDSGDPYVALVNRLIAWSDDRQQHEPELMAEIERLRGGRRQTI